MCFSFSILAWEERPRVSHRSCPLHFNQEYGYDRTIWVVVLTMHRAVIHTTLKLCFALGFPVFIYLGKPPRKSQQTLFVYVPYS